MSKPAARLGDSHSCQKDGNGQINQGSPNIFINYQAAARIGDSAVCANQQQDSIEKGSASVILNGKPAARQGDLMLHGGNVANGSSNVRFGDNGRCVRIGNCGRIDIGGNGNSVNIG